MLWDFTASGNNRVTFKLEPDIIPTRIWRRYELGDTQEYLRANPEGGIVVVRFEEYNGFDVLVIPVGTLEIPGIPVEGVEWEDWGHHVMKLKTRPRSKFSVFHTHVLFLDTVPRGPSVVVPFYVYDFSPYSRRAVKDDSTHVQWCGPFQVLPAIVNTLRPRPQPLAVIRSGKISVGKLEGDYHFLPAENGIVVIRLQVRIPVVAKHIRVLTRFTSQPDSSHTGTGTAMWHQVCPRIQQL